MLSANQPERAAIRSRLQRSPDVRRFAFVSRADAVRTFRRVFATQPDVADHIAADQLPASFRIGLRARAHRRALMRALRRMKGVDTAVQSRIFAGTAVVRGMLREVGGPAPGFDRGVYGTVRIRIPHGKVVATTKTGPDGTYSFSVKPRAYELTGSSPVANVPCSARKIVSARPGAVVQAAVVCNIR